MSSLPSGVACALLILVSYGGQLASGSVASTPVIDGFVEDREWAGAVEVARLTSPAIDPGMVEAGETVVQVLFDEEAIYIGARMSSLSADATGEGLSGDRPEATDWLIATFEGEEGSDRALVFAVTSDGDARSALVLVESDSAGPGLESWQVSTAQTVDGWSAEFRIPLAELQFGGAPGEQVVGMTFERRIAFDESGRNRQRVATGPGAGRS